MVKTGSAGWYATHVSKPFVILLIMALKQFNHESSVKERCIPAGIMTFWRLRKLGNVGHPH